jgi:hypothetical protein
LSLWIALVLASPTPALANGPGWSIRSVAQPSNFSIADKVDTVVRLSVSATGGSYELKPSLGGASTGPIPYNATASELQSALETVTTIGPGNVTVAGGPGDEGATKAYTVTWDGSFTGGGGPGFLELVANNLTGGSSTVKVAQVSSGGSLDRYALFIANASHNPTQEGQTITITDSLPQGVIPVDVAGKLASGGELACSHTPIVQCTYGEVVPPGEVIVVAVKVAVTTGESSTVTNSATIEGGGAAFTSVSTGHPATVANTVNGAPASFGIQDFALEALDANGAPDTQAGAHPYSLTTSFDFNSVLFPGIDAAGHNQVSLGEAPITTPQAVRTVVSYLPLGLVGDPLATPRCQEHAVESEQCPTDSVLGTRLFNFEGNLSATNQPLYNVLPEAGYPAEFAADINNKDVAMYSSIVPSTAGYQLRVAVPAVPQAYTFNGVTLTLFGNPAEHNGNGDTPAAFLTNPARCSLEPEKTRLEANSWEEPERWVSAESTVYPQITGCDLLQFNPAIEVTPETTEADTPSGYEIDVKVPQSPNVFPDLATPELKDAAVTLPAGLSVSPSAADGLIGCTAEEIGLLATEQGPDGLPRAAAGHCPAGSQLGTIEIRTPLLPEPLKGHSYLALPKCDPCNASDAREGRMLGLYLEAAGSGVIVKLEGTISANPTTGQLTAHFDENPQLPFDELKMVLNGGPRAPLANPQTCGIFTTRSELLPWSSPATPNADPSSSLGIGGCAPTMPFGPAFTAGTLRPNAGGFSPFTLTYSRQDGEQDLGGIAVRMPPGLLGRISEVPLCGEPQAGEGTCPAASRIGSTSVAAGAGSHPLWLSGQVYLTTSYKGAPFGLSIVVPEKAGPFDLGDEVVRAAINIDPHTAALTVTSDPLPQQKDGVPFRLKTVNVTIDRPNFMFNPTNCSQQTITSKISGVLPDGSAGASVPVSTAFALSGCKNLPFKPRLTVLTEAKTSKADGAYLHVKVTSGPGQANIGKVKVDLPKQLPSRLTTLQKACIAAVFEANPASCPTASVVGTGTAVTPALKSPLTGPAYLVSHGGAAFPDLELVLQGEGITLDLVGNTDIKKGITSSTFNALPDAPISTFDLVLPKGPHSVLATNLPTNVKYSMCGQKLAMPTAITGQNGAVVKQTTKIAVAGCPKAKKANKGRKTSGKHLKAGKE